MPPAPKHTRRWYQFGLAELFVLVTLLVAIWWHAAHRPLYDEWRDGWTGEIVKYEPRKPSIAEVIDRGLMWTIAFGVVWFVGRHRTRKANQPPHPKDTTTQFR